MPKNETSLIISLRAEHKKLVTDFQKATAQMNRFTSDVRKQGDLLSSHLTTMLSVGAIAAFGKSQYELVKQLNASNSALKAVTETSYDYNRAKKLLTDTAEAYGLEIQSLTKSYVSFTAAAKDTALEGAKAEEIFQRVMRASSVMGLSIDETDGVLRALSQIMSKGTVQAEELRGQLGDRLPGSFNIMARALGVTTAELGKMMKAGTVLADDALPKFAVELEKTYGSSNVQRVETMVAAQNRFTNAWKEFIMDVETGTGIISESTGAVFEWGVELIELANNLQKVVTKADNFKKSVLQGLPPPIRAMIILFSALKKGVEEFNDAMEENPNQNLADEHAAHVINLVDAMDLAGKSQADFKRQITDIFETARKKGMSVVEVNKLLSETTDAYVKSIGSEEEELKKAFEEWNKRAEAFAQQKELTDSLTMAYERLRDAQLDIDKEGIMAALRGPQLDVSDSVFEEDTPEIAEESDPYGPMAEAIRRRLEEIKGLADQLNQVIEGTVENAVFAIADAFGSGEDPFKAFLGTVGSGLQEMGRMLIGVGIGITAFKRSLETLNPAIALAAGATLVALGAAFKGAASRTAGGGGGGGSRGGTRDFSNSRTSQSIKVEFGPLELHGKTLVAAAKAQTRDRGR